jgi:hypothetical protein
MNLSASRACGLTVVGYAILATAMLAFLTINGVSDTAVGTICTAILIALGVLLAVGGMAALARSVTAPDSAVTTSLVMQSLGIVGLLVGFVVSFFASSLSGHLLAAVVIALSWASGLTGAVVMTRASGPGLLVLGAALLGLGAAFIPASNIAVQAGWMVDTDKNVYQDLGATIAAWGFILAAYGFNALRDRVGTSVAYPGAIS